MTVFVDTSVWYAAADRKDRHNVRAKMILAENSKCILSDHVLVETWLLLKNRISRNAAETFWRKIRQGPIKVEKVTVADLDAAWNIGAAFSDQPFSIVDRTSFALMERLGLRRAASFDHHFSVYRYGRGRRRAFDVVN